jgi:hypothetical protein
MDAETKRVTIRSRARHLRRAKSGSFQQNARLRIVERNPWICAVQRAASYFTLRMRMLQEVTLFLLLAFYSHARHAASTAGDGLRDEERIHVDLVALCAKRRPVILDVEV